MTERAELVFELGCLDRLLCGEYVAHLKHDLELFLGKLVEADHRATDSRGV
jgi:hypothetical protein